MNMLEKAGHMFRFFSFSRLLALAILEGHALSTAPCEISTPQVTTITWFVEKQTLAVPPTALALFFQLVDELIHHTQDKVQMTMMICFWLPSIPLAQMTLAAFVLVWSGVKWGSESWQFYHLRMGHSRSSHRLCCVIVVPLGGCFYLELSPENEYHI